MTTLTDCMINDEVLALAAAKGLTIDVEYSEGHDSPRESCSSILVTSNNNVTSVAEAKLPSDEWGSSIEAAISNYARLNNIDEADMMWWPVYAYIHGNVAFGIESFNIRWDSGLIGFIYESKKSIREEFGVKRISSNLTDKITQRIKDELATLTDWANGTIYAVSISKDGEHLDSLSGIYSQNDKYTSEVALEMIRNHSDDIAA